VRQDKRPCCGLDAMCLSWEMTDHRLALKAVKGFHTFAWFTIEACMMFVLYSGIRRRTDRRVGQAAAVVGGEILRTKPQVCQSPGNGRGEGSWRTPPKSLAQQSLSSP
jgi:hypothetical protein